MRFVRWWMEVYIIHAIIKVTLTVNLINIYLMGKCVYVTHQLMNTWKSCLKHCVVSKGAIQNQIDCLRSECRLALKTISLKNKNKNWS